MSKPPEAYAPTPLCEIKTTKDVKIPKDILDQVIGQPKAVKKVRLGIGLMKFYRNKACRGPILLLTGNCAQSARSVAPGSSVPGDAVADAPTELSSPRHFWEA